MRLFIGSMLSAADDAFYGELVGRLRASVGPRVLRPVPVGTCHLTHAFLGDVGGENLDAIDQVVRALAPRMAAVDIQLGRPEVLGGGRGPRALLVPVVSGRQALFDQQVDLALALRRVPVLEVLPLPKPPHVTIGRFSRTATRRDGQLVTERIAQLADELRAVRIDRMALIRSTLTSSGPRYDSLLEISLGVG